YAGQRPTGQHHMYRGARRLPAGDGVLDPQCPTVFEHDLFDDRQPQTGSGHRPRGGGPVEPLEDQPAFLRRDARAVVGHHQCGVHRVDLGPPDPDPAAGRAPFGGVVEQVHHRAAQPGRVTVDRPGDHLDVEVDVVAAASNPFQAAVDHVGDVDRLVDHAAGVVTGEVHQIPHQR